MIIESIHIKYLNGENMKKTKIVLTGGPGGGKTTALELFRRELKEDASIIPEAATILFENGFPRGDDTETMKLTQMAIYELQGSLEKIFNRPRHKNLTLCDRGTLDGLAYWPDSEESFFETINSSFEYELKRYDAVIFFESGAQSGSNMGSNNPYRLESIEKAKQLDNRLKDVWSRHPEFHLIKSNESFISKVMDGLAMIKKLTS